MSDEIGETTGEESNGTDVTRRRVMQSAGTVVVGTAALAGSADATGGKGISWVAFCGCTDGFCIKWRVYDDEGEMTKLGYEGDCTVYYKAGRNIYRHEYTRPSGNWSHPVIETSHAGEEDPVASTTPSDSRDPCGILNNSGGTKLEEAEIESYEYDCPNENGVTTTEEDDDENGGHNGKGNGKGN